MISQGNEQSLLSHNPFSSRSSFESIEKWVEDARKIVDPDVIYVLLGNHADKEAE